MYEYCMIIFLDSFYSVFILYMCFNLILKGFRRLEILVYKLYLKNEIKFDICKFIYILIFL